MSYLGTDIFNMSVAIIDEISDTGTINDTQVAEYKNRAPYLLDLWQKEMAKSGDLFKTFEVSCFRKQNLLGDLNHFKAVEHMGGIDQYNYEAIGANCFYFEVDKDATVYLEENIGGVWSPLAGSYLIQNGTVTALNGTINITVTGQSFVSCKGILSPTNSTNSIRIRFSGTYYYRHNNRALSPYKFPTSDKVPDFKPWYKVTMPSDFKSKSQIIDEYPMWQYEQDSSHKWEGNNELYIQFGYEGIVRIKYIPVPAKITALTQTLEVDDVTATSGAYYLAEHFAIADQNDTLAAMCRNKFNQLKLDSMIKSPLSPQDIKDFYGISGIK